MAISAAKGRLVFVVGASGVGKDTLMMGARTALANADGVRFVRRVITRVPDPGAEDHDTLTREAFAEAARADAFALTWHAHGLDYGLPASLDGDLSEGRIMVANGSRAAVDAALERYQRPGRAEVRVVKVTAPKAALLARLVARGRETAADIERRLEREDPPLPVDAQVIEVMNDGAVEDGVERLVAAITREMVAT
jgi:phosphonate metabolism protein PhnN/1,5-bisphosphokinase (PRPP-forming)